MLSVNFGIFSRLNPLVFRHDMVSGVPQSTVDDFSGLTGILGPCEAIILISFHFELTHCGVINVAS